MSQTVDTQQQIASPKVQLMDQGTTVSDPATYGHTIHNYNDIINLHDKNGLYVTTDGDKYYFQDNKLHRTDGPAIEGLDGYNAYYLNDKRHRTDGPAIECANGEKHWYLNGERHRTDGPAIDLADGNKWWYQEGKLHRIGGPAVECANGERFWFRNGQRVGACYESVDTLIATTDEPVTYYYYQMLDLDNKQGLYVTTNGNKYYYQNNQLHRTDGPAIEHLNGYREHYLNGQRHRVDGPAVEHSNGYREYYWFGLKLSEREYNLKNKSINNLIAVSNESIAINEDDKN